MNPPINLGMDPRCKVKISPAFSSFLNTSKTDKMPRIVAVILGKKSAPGPIEFDGGNAFAVNQT